MICDYIPPCFWKHHFTPCILSSKQHPRLSHVALEIPGQPHSLRSYGCILHGCPIDKDINNRIDYLEMFQEIDALKIL